MPDIPIWSGNQVDSGQTSLDSTLSQLDAYYSSARRNNAAASSGVGPIESKLQEYFASKGLGGVDANRAITLYSRFGYGRGMSPSQFAKWYSGLDSKARVQLSSDIENLYTQPLNHGVLDSGWNNLASKYGLDNSLGGQSVDAAPAGQQDSEYARIQKEIQDFYQRMSAPVVDANGNYTEPVAAQLAQMGRNEAGRAASNQGIEGGTALGSGMASLVMGNVNPWLMQRQGLAQQALGMLSNNALSKEQLAQGWGRLSLEGQGSQYNQAQNQAQGMGSAVGGAIGSIWGPVGGQVGSRLGGGLASLGAGSYNPQYSPKNYGY